MNIVILLGGEGVRFKHENYIRPKPLVNISGKPIVNWLLDLLIMAPEDHLYIVYQKELEKYGFVECMKDSHIKNSQLFPIVNYTRGACETLLCLLQQMSPEELCRPLITLDGDTFYETDILDIFRKYDHKHCIFYHDTTENAPIFSYITLQSNQVIEIQEKVKISPHACTGSYGFGDGHQLLYYARKLIDTPLKTEYYMSMIYDLMLKDNIPVYAEQVDKFHCVGTPTQLKQFVHKLSTENSICKRQHALRVCFDLDNTLVTVPSVAGDYSTVKPLHENIVLCQEMKKMGHTIIIYTARRMRTHSGNLGRVMADIAGVTLDNLRNFDIPFDEIYFGKPYADIYIDDKSINPLYGLDKELGVYSTVREPEQLSQFSVMPCRNFNRIEVRDDQITKYSTFEHLEGEIYWYNHVHPSMRLFIPTILDSNLSQHVVCYINMERIRGPTYSQLYVNGALTPSGIQKLLDVLGLIHTSPHNEHQSIDILDHYIQKVISRFDTFHAVYNEFPNIDETKDLLIRKLKEYEQSGIAQCTVIHGDPVFTNVVIGTSVKLIDMRGKVGSVCSIRGDMFYDFAKMYQSLVGYDFILMEKTPTPVYANNMAQYFLDWIHKTYPAVEPYIHTLTASLFFSLIPLHNDEPLEKRRLYLTMCQKLLTK